jgi:hypothetical protein
VNNSFQHFANMMGDDEQEGDAGVSRKPTRYGSIPHQNAEKPSQWTTMRLYGSHFFSCAV